ncbi:hypothetical protein K474DRAFT_1582168, partial [Panus rudis PR-1116 ss-1]
SFCEALALARSGHSSAITDLCWTLRNLSPPVVYDYHLDLTPRLLQDLLTQVTASAQKLIDDGLKEYLKLVLLHDRKQMNKEGQFVHEALLFRDYLKIPHPAHRKAVTRLICSDHPLAVEQLRRVDGVSIRRMWRVCRFCHIQGNVEDEQHVLLYCMGNDAIVHHRNVF